MTEKISAEAGIKGGKLEVTGKAASRLGHQLADLISPFSEVAGAAGDHINVWRQASLLRSLELAHKIAEAKGIAIKPVSPKFLIPWAEKASLEEDDQLAELWAVLLLSSMGDYDSTSNWVANVLSEIGPLEAKILKTTFESYNAYFDNSGFDEDNYHNVSALSVIQIVEDTELLLLVDTIDQSIKKVENFFDDNDFIMVPLRCHCRDPHTKYSSNISASSHLLREVELFAVEYLVTKGLFTKFTLQFHIDGSVFTSYSIESARLSPSGWKFMKRVT